MKVYVDRCAGHVWVDMWTMGYRTIYEPAFLLCFAVVCLVCVRTCGQQPLDLCITYLQYSLLSVSSSPPLPPPLPSLHSTPSPHSFPPWNSPSLCHISSQIPIQTLLPLHYDAVSAMALWDNTLFSACGVTIKLWGMDTFRINQVLLDFTYSYEFVTY